MSTATTTATTRTASIPPDPTKSLPSSTTTDWYRHAGDACNIAQIVTNLALTCLVMNGGLGRDDLWHQRGFCVQRQEDTTSIDTKSTGSTLTLTKSLLSDTEVWCSVVLFASALICSLWWLNSLGGNTEKLLMAKLKGLTESNFSHGAGHLFLNLIGYTVY